MSNWKLPVRQTDKYDVKDHMQKLRFLNDLMAIILEELRGCSATKNNEARKFFHWWRHGKIVV